MATFNAYQAINFSIPGTFYSPATADVISAWTTRITIKLPSGGYQEYGGSFSYIISGGTPYLNLDASTLTKFIQYQSDWSVVFSIAEGNVPGSIYQSYTAQLNYVGLLAYIFRDNDTIYGSSASDHLMGYAGNDRLYGRTGEDTLDGGGGIDTADYMLALQGVTITLATITAQDTLGAGTNTLINIENLSGSIYNDQLTGNALDNFLAGNAGNDTLSGGDGDDSLQGNNGHDTLLGNGGNDTLCGNEGNDTLEGGAGFDWADYTSYYWGVSINLARSVDQENDTLRSIEGLIGSRYADHLIGNASHNRLQGMVGDDTLAGGAGNDTLDGGVGVDWADYASARQGVSVSLSVTTAQNTIGAGTDTLLAIEGLLG